MTEEDIRVGKYALATCIYVLKDIKIVGRLRLEPAIYTFYLHVSVYFILTLLISYTRVVRLMLMRMLMRRPKQRLNNNYLKKTNRSENHVMTTSAE